MKKFFSIFLLCASVAHAATTVIDSRKWTLPGGVVDIRAFGAQPNGVTDITSAWASAKAIVGTNGVVFFPFVVGTSNIYYASGTLDLTGARILSDHGVTISVNQTTGIDYKSVLAQADISLTVRAKNKTYFLPRNTGDRSLSNGKSVRRSAYTSGAILRFDTDFTTGKMNFDSATPGAPGVAPTVTTNKYQIDTETVATTVYLGPWIRPKVGQTVEMSAFTASAQTSGHLQAVICDSVGAEYVGVEVIDFANSLKSLPNEVNLVRMASASRTRTSRIAVPDDTYMAGHNGTHGRTVTLGVRMLTPNKAQFYVNHLAVGEIALAGNADRIFFGFNGTYSGGTSAFFDPVSFEDKPMNKPRDFKVAVFGDSLAAGSSTTLPWPELLPHFLQGAEGIGNVTVLNYAHSGDTAQTQQGVMAGVSLSGVDATVIEVGINDVEGAVLADTFESYLALMISQAQTASSVPFVVVPPLYAKQGNNSVRGGTIRARAARTALYKGARVIDPISLVGTNFYALGVGDGIHPKIDGNLAIAESVALEILKGFAVDQPQVLADTRRVGGNYIGRGTAAPTRGNFRVGDIVENSTPAAGGNIGWVCTTAGQPGTWKTFGAIAP